MRKTKVSSLQSRCNEIINKVEYEDYKVSYESDGYIYEIGENRYIVIEMENLEKEYPNDNTLVFILNGKYIAPLIDIKIAEEVLKLYDNDL